MVVTCSFFSSGYCFRSCHSINFLSKNGPSYKLRQWNSTCSMALTAALFEKRTRIKNAQNPIYINLPALQVQLRKQWCETIGPEIQASQFPPLTTETERPCSTHIVQLRILSRTSGISLNCGQACLGLSWQDSKQSFSLKFHLGMVQVTKKNTAPRIFWPCERWSFSSFDLSS